MAVYHVSTEILGVPKISLAGICVLVVIAIAMSARVKVSNHATERAAERGVDVKKMLIAAKKGEVRRGGKNGCTKKCTGGVCAVVSRWGPLRGRTVLTTYKDA